MNLITISEVSKNFNISTRTLRYYEQIGLLQSVKKEDYAYRTYDEAAVLRLQQIVVLRKLRIPLKQIITILESENTAEIIETFRQNLNEVDDEITALSTIKSILNTFIKRLNENAHLDIKVGLLDDISILDIVDSLTVTKIAFKEEKTMADLYQASEKINKLTDNDVRIIYLPPMTVAAASAVGENCEGQAADMINRFVMERDLLKIKPDIRHFGFDCSAGKTGVGQSSHKYQMWVSIPDKMDVPEPLVKRTFIGGLYASHMIKMGDFDHWILLREWVMNNEKYEHDWPSIRCAPYENDMDRCFEEQLNYWGNIQNPDFDNKNMQLDLLFPIKEKVYNKKIREGDVSMSFEITKVYKEHFPELRLIGKCYTNADRVNGSFGAKWGEWFQKGLFGVLEALGTSTEVDNGYLGLMTAGASDDSNFTYWIGMLFPPETSVPNGFSYIDLPESDIGMTWIHGHEENGEIFGAKPHVAAYEKLRENGWGKLNNSAGGADTLVFFERYNCPRYTQKDADGCVTLDYGFFLG